LHDQKEGQNLPLRIAFGQLRLLEEHGGDSRQGGRVGGVQGHLQLVQKTVQLLLYGADEELLHTKQIPTKLTVSPGERNCKN
jgi:hypothetical protein